MLKVIRLGLLGGVAMVAFGQVDLGGDQVVSSGCNVGLTAITGASCTAYEVPAGKRLVVQTATAFCQLTNGSGATATAEISDARMSRQWGGSENLVLPVTFAMQKAGSGVFSTSPNLVTTWNGRVTGPFYAEGRLTFEVIRFVGTIASATCRMVFDGYLVPIAQAPPDP